MLPYSVFALRTVARAASKQPELYEKFMLQAAVLNPTCYYDLGDYALSQTNEDKATGYYDRAAETDPDSVRVANHSEWRVRYCLKQGQTDKARKIADFAGEVYSSSGLQAKAVFFELTTNYDEAFAWYVKDEERYDDSTALVNFCLRYKKLTGDTRFDSELQKRTKKLFPRGMENVSLQDFHGPPTDGVVFNGQSRLMTAAGLKNGDVIVAVYGVRVHNFKQYAYGRGLKDTPELDLIVWQCDAYREFKPNLPGHLFKVDMKDYTSN